MIWCVEQAEKVCHLLPDVFLIFTISFILYGLDESLI